MNRSATDPDVELDPVTLAVLAGRLSQVADEMDATLFRSAFNPIIAEAHDASHGLYHRDTGATLVQGSNGLPVFVGSMSGAVAMIVERIRADARRAGGEDSVAGAVAVGTLCDGDVFLTNDPYEAGTHLNDMKLVRPYFRNGEVWCHLASVGHFTDVGGAVAGNYNPAATDIHAEGVLLSPLKLRRAGVVDESVVDLVCSIGRSPTNAYGDLHAQLNALDLGVRRLDELLDDYGDEVVTEALSELTSRASELMRSHLAELPDGTWSAVEHLDNDGGTSQPIRVELELTIEGSELHLDFSGTADAVAGPVNISTTTARAACYVALKHLFREVPANAGCMEPVRITLPEGSLLAASAPRPVGGYTETILRIMDLVFECVALADPTLSNGCSYGTINALSISHGGDDPWVLFGFYGGGLGGSPVSDGLNHGNAPLSTATIPPLEIIEARYPVRYTRWALREDSAGPGLHRGGLGASYEIELLAPDAEAFAFGDRAHFAPAGVAGGAPAALNRVSFVTDGIEHDASFGAKSTGEQLRAGDRIRIDTPGGGGYGDAQSREPAAVARDVALGYVSREAALAEYRVALDDAGDIDLAATEALRVGNAGSER